MSSAGHGPKLGKLSYPGSYVDPTDEIHLEHLIKWALSSPEWDYRPNSAARCLTWAWVAEKLEGVYREVLQCSLRKEYVR